MLYITICLLVFSALYFYNCLKPRDYPPGPRWVPLLGCFLTFKWLIAKHGYAYAAMQALSRTYGPILGLKIGSQRVVVISTYELVKQGLTHDDLNSRPDGFFFRFRAFGKRKGIVFVEGNAWSKCRKFMMQHWRSYGFGRPVMKDRLLFEAKSLVEHLDRLSATGPVSMHRAFDVAVLNNMWIMIAGRRFDYADENLEQALTCVHDAFRLLDCTDRVLSQMPFLRFVIPQLSGYNEMAKILGNLWRFLDEEIKAHENKEPITIAGDEPRDLIDAFLSEISRNSGAEDTIFDRENLLVLCLDLFLAATKTTTDTLAIVFLFLSLNPEWLTTIQAELDNVVGRCGTPTEDDLPSLSMTQAFLTEVQRCLTLTPLGVPHRAEKDVFLNGYRIPKDTTVLFNLYSVHNDERYWEQPDKFRPQRFLDEEGKFRPNNNVLSFGLGKRRCPGEQLARSSMFLLFTHVVHHFDVEISPYHGKPDPRCNDGIALSPKPFYLKLTKRSRGQESC